LRRRSPMARRRRARNLTTATAAGCAPRRWASSSMWTPCMGRSTRRNSRRIYMAAHMAPSRELHEAEKVAGDAVEHKLLMESLVQPVAEKNAPLKCNHGHPKNQCKDCGTGHCGHGRPKSQCRDCGTGHCLHGRPKSKCKDCGTGHCVHGRRKGCCRDCGTGHCVHRRRTGRCKDCSA
jgi:hypothetical protein